MSGGRWKSPLVTLADYADLVRDIDPSFADVDVVTVGPRLVHISLRPTLETMGDSVERLRDAIETWRPFNLHCDIQVLLHDEQDGRT